MSHRNRFSRLAVQQSRHGKGRRRQSWIASPYVRRLHLEQLEHRRMLAAFTVDTLLDIFDPGAPTTDGLISLREAILAANSNAAVGDAPAGSGADTIDFSVTGAINLAFGELVVTDDLTINGPGASQLTIDAQGTSRVMAVDNAATANISGLTLTGGSADQGGGLRNYGGSTTTLSGVVILGNMATSSGIIDGGGGVYSSGDLTITGSTISANTAAGDGGGVMNRHGNLTITDSTISGNAASDDGGGVWSYTNVTGTETTTITNSTISGNTATDDGGGLYNFSGLTVIEHSTITLNEATGDGDGVASSGSGALNTRTEVHSSIIAGNTGDDDVHFNNIFNHFFSFEYNLIGGGNATGKFNQTGDQIGSSGGDLNVSIDMAAMGNFEFGGFGNDSYVFEYSLNGGSFLSLFTSSVDEAGSLIYTFEDGSTQTDDDPLQINGTTLDNQFQSLLAVVPGSAVGDSLELRLTATTDGAFDVFAFRNITVQWATGNGVIGRALGPEPDLNVAFVQDDPDYTISGDMFGIRSRTNPGTPGLPDDIVDDTVASPPDIQGGIIRSTDMADFFGIVDTVNGTGNDVNVARWTFAIDVIDPLLGLLQDNGGPTETHALLVGSPAIDLGDPAASPGVGTVPLFDQRGNNFGRVQNGRIDIGAFEVTETASADFDGDGFITGFDFLLWQIGVVTPAPDAVKTDGDADNDLDVDSSDLDVWELQYGTAAPLAAAAIVHPSLALPIEGREQPEPSLASSDLADVALTVALVEEADGISGKREFVAHSPPLEFFSAEPIGRNASIASSSISSSTTTSTPRDDERQSPEGPSPWEDALDEVFASLFE